MTGKQKNATLAINKVVTILQKSGQSGKQVAQLRRAAFELKRTAKLLACLACECPFLLIIYTSKAESVV